MDQNNPPSSKPPSSRLSGRARLSIAAFLVVLLLLLLPRQQREPSQEVATKPQSRLSSSNPSLTRPPVITPRGPNGATNLTAEEIVARRVAQFARGRLQLAEEMAAHFKVELLDDVRRFFAAVGRGDWEEIDAAFKTLAAQRNVEPRRADLDKVWRAIQETYGAAEQAHDWPAQKLLDYGNGILAALRPGMVYVDGTDPGCFIPTFLNETSGGERHIVLTQNALADNSYLDYLRYLHGDRMQTLTADDSQRAFAEYVADAAKRLQHDQDFPDEPKQVRPGEQIKRHEDGRIDVGGQVAVMGINEKLLQTLLEKNQDLSFGYEESFPLKTTYADATPLGPIMELRAADAQNTFTAENATQTLDYWRTTTKQLLADSESSASPEVLKTYSHTAVAQANLLAARAYPAEAEQAYRLASDLWPGNPESVGHLSALLTQQGRAEEARQIIEAFVDKYPDQKGWLETSSAWSVVSGAPQKPPEPNP